jgi:hypothetical protein
MNETPKPEAAESKHGRLIARNKAEKPAVTCVVHR